MSGAHACILFVVALFSMTSQQIHWKHPTHDLPNEFTGIVDQDADNAKWMFENNGYEDGSGDLNETDETTSEGTFSVTSPQEELVTNQTTEYTENYTASWTSEPTADPTTSEDITLVSPEGTTESQEPEVSTDRTAETTTNREEVTTPNATQICAPGYFGLNCAYRCYCKHLSDVCDPVYGYCTSGCHTGWYGPGCIVEKRPGSLAIVVALSILLVLTLILCLGMFMCLMGNVIQEEKNRFRRVPEESTSGAVSYEIPDMTSGTLPTQRSHQPLSKYLKPSVPRIKETDIQIMNEVIGKGKFGDINRGFVKKGKGNIEVAFKTLSGTATEEDTNDFTSRLSVNSSVGKHQNVIQFFGVCAVGGQLYAAFEYAPRGNLKSFLRKNSDPESQRDSNSTRMFFASNTSPLQIALEITNGMLFLTSKKIVHGGLCARHILLSSRYTAKIHGFQPIGSRPHALRWTAPEAIQNGLYSSKSDVWSFGVLLWEIVTFGAKPYSDLEPNDLYSLLNSGYRMPQPDGIEYEVYAVMRACWHKSPEERPSFQALSARMADLVSSQQAKLDDIDVGLDDDLGNGSRFGRIAFDNSVFETDT